MGTAAPEALPERSNVNLALRWASATLDSAGVPSPRLDSEVLLAHTLGWKRARLYAYPEFVLPEGPRVLFVALVERRTQREPVPYIVGHREFYGLDFLADRRALIPRPETELLVERALQSARGMGAPDRALTLVDVGTGSGIVAISLARHLSTSTVYATDVAQDALDLAAVNVQRHGLADRIRLLFGNLLEPVPEAVHLVVANLPYISRGNLRNLARDVVDYEPPAALDGGVDGLELVGGLLAQAAGRLLLGAEILLEIGAFQAARATDLARDFFPGAEIDVFQDYAHLDRNLRIRTGPAYGVPGADGRGGL
jgi:release factor glutamine methyltransferase